MDLQDYLKSKGLTDERTNDIVGILLLDKNIVPHKKIKWSFELFKSNPSYAISMEFKMSYTDFHADMKRLFWENYRSILLDGKSGQIEQIQYSLWVDFFEDPQTVDESWSGLVDENTRIEVLRNILTHSGPVPYDKKKQLYNRLISDRDNHKYIFESLFGSFFDVFGKVDILHARKILKELKVDKESKNYLKLEKYLYKFNTKKEFQDYLLKKNKQSDKRL